MSAETTPLRVTLGPEVVTRYDAEAGFSDYGGDYDGRPYAVEVSRRLTVWFGATTRAPKTTKRLRGFGRFESVDPPTEAQWNAAQVEAHVALDALIDRHGIERPIPTSSGGVPTVTAPTTPPHGR